MEAIVFFGMIGALGVLWGERALPSTKKTEEKKSLRKLALLKRFLKK